MNYKVFKLYPKIRIDCVLLKTHRPFSCILSYLIFVLPSKVVCAYILFFLVIIKRILIAG